MELGNYFILEYGPNHVINVTRICKKKRDLLSSENLFFLEICYQAKTFFS